MYPLNDALGNESFDSKRDALEPGSNAENTTVSHPNRLTGTSYVDYKLNLHFSVISMAIKPWLQTEIANHSSRATIRLFKIHY